MKQSIICVGISGSGKSSFSKQFQKEHPSYIRVNRDDLRAALFNMEGYYNSPLFSDRESLINVVVYNIIDSSSPKNNFIFDNTNLNIIHLNKLLGQLTLENIDFKFKFFDIELEEAKQRVLCRDYGYVERDDNKVMLVWEEDNQEISYDVNNLSEVKYIDKQFLDYLKIKEYILTNFKEKIME